LLGMRERVALFDGTLTVESAPGRGTTVIARVPLPDGSREGGDVYLHVFLAIDQVVVQEELRAGSDLNA